jgi:hypothetical protein
MIMKKAGQQAPDRDLAYQEPASASLLLASNVC